MKKKYRVELSQDERARLTELLRVGKCIAYKRTHAQILLLVDQGEHGPAEPDQRVAEVCCVALNTVANVRKRLVTRGVDAALNRKKQDRPSRLPRFDGAAEARLTQLACGPAPDGRSRWTLELLAEHAVALNIVETVSPETVRRTLKKRAQAAPQQVLVHPEKAQRVVRLHDGERPGGLPQAV